LAAQLAAQAASTPTPAAAAIVTKTPFPAAPHVVSSETM
jgi:hypothetical protein